jgi:hypothetical protein
MTAGAIAAQSLPPPRKSPDRRRLPTAGFRFDQARDGQTQIFAPWCGNDLHPERQLAVPFRTTATRQPCY